MSNYSLAQISESLHKYCGKVMLKTKFRELVICFDDII